MLSKWTFYQLSAILFIVILFFLTEQLSSGIFITSGNDTFTLSSILIAGFIVALVGWVYVMIYLQSKKKPALLNHDIWSRMPIISFMVGFLSIVAFLTLGTFGPLLEWTQDVRWLIYVIVVYFVFVFYLFVLSLVLKYTDEERNALHHSFYWTSGALLVVIFMI